MWLRRATSPGIDALTSTSALEAFAGRQDAAWDTIRTLGLDRNQAVLIGSAGLAIQGVDMHLAGPHATFDVDACVGEQAFSRLRELEDSYVRPDRPDMQPTEVHVAESSTTLPFSGIRSPFHEGFVHSFKARTFESLRDRAVTIGHAATLPAVDLLNAKLDRGNIKDLAGIIKGHAVAWTTDHPVASDQSWQWGVIRARSSLIRKADCSRTVQRNLPTWLAPLVASGFDHPAFRLNPDPAILLQRAS